MTAWWNRKRPARPRTPPVVPRMRTARRGVFDVGAGAKTLSPSGKEYDALASAYGALEPIDDSICATLLALKRQSRVEAARGGHLRAAVLTFRREVVGRGIRLHSMHDDAVVREAVEREWTRWAAREADAAGRQSLRSLLHTAVSSLVVDGEILIRERFDGPGRAGYSLELLDSCALDLRHNVPVADGRRWCRMGVEMDARRRPTAYWLADTELARGYAAMARAVPAETVVHVFESDMPQQTRGVPWAFATLRRFAELREYDDAERQSAKLSASLFAAYSPPETVGAAQLEEDGDKEEEVHLKPGDVFNMDPGGSMLFHTPQHPTTAYPDYVRANLEAAAAAVGIAYSSLTGDLSRANFVSSRLGRLQERGTVEAVRDLLVEQILTRVFERWLLRASARGLLPDAPLDDLERAEFVGPAFVHVQPREAAVADHQRLEDGLVSKAELIRESGRDARDVLAEIERERAEKL